MKPLHIISGIAFYEESNQFHVTLEFEDGSIFFSEDGYSTIEEAKHEALKWAKKWTQTDNPTRVQ